LPYRHEWLVPGSGKSAEGPAGVHTLIANIKGNIRLVSIMASAQALPRYLANPVTLQPAFWNRKCLTVCFMLA